MLSLELASEGATVTIAVSGELDLATVDEFRELATTNLREPTTDKLVVDMTGLDFLDSTGLSCLVDLQLVAAADGKRFELRSLQPRLTRMMDLVGMHDYFAMS